MSVLLDEETTTVVLQGLDFTERCDTARHGMPEHPAEAMTRVPMLQCGRSALHEAREATARGRRFAARDGWADHLRLLQRGVHVL